MSSCFRASFGSEMCFHSVIDDHLFHVVLSMTVSSPCKGTFGVSLLVASISRVSRVSDVPASSPQAVQTSAVPSIPLLKLLAIASQQQQASECGVPGSSNAAREPSTPPNSG